MTGNLDSWTQLTNQNVPEARLAVTPPLATYSLILVICHSRLSAKTTAFNYLEESVLGSNLTN